MAYFEIRRGGDISVQFCKSYKCKMLIGKINLQINFSRFSLKQFLNDEHKDILSRKIDSLLQQIGDDFIEK